MAPDWVSVPEIVSVSSTSRMVPPLIETLEARVPVLFSFNDPVANVIAPDKLLPELIESSVFAVTVKLPIVEDWLIFRPLPELPATLTLTDPTVTSASNLS